MTIPVVLFILLDKLVLTFESVDEIIKMDHSLKSTLLNQLGCRYLAGNFIPEMG